MDIYSLCPLRVGTLLWEAQPEQLTLTVTVKATLTLVHGGEATLAPEQDPIGDERHWDNNALASLQRPGDNAPLKPKVDILLTGHAHAPGAVPTSSLAVRLRVGELVKSLRVNGDRTFSDEDGRLAPTEPAPFTRMPLRYERALLSADNPVGIDPHAPPIAGALAFPNIEPEGRAGIAGFGPVAPTWRARRKLLDDASLFWAYGLAAEGRVSAGPAPPGFNFAFFNTAPKDQQLDLLRGGAPIELDHLHPAHPQLVTRLPALRPQVFRVHPRTGRAEEIVLRCDTLWIDGDRGVAVLSFRGLCDLGGKDEALVGALVVAADPQGKKLRFEKVEEQLRTERGVELRPARASTRGGDAVGDADPLSLRHDTVKSSRASGPAAVAPPAEPEGGDAATARIQRPAEPAPPPARLPPREAQSERTQDISQLPKQKIRRATLPFQDDEASPGSAGPAGAPAPRRPALPFSQARPRKPATVPPPAPIAPAPVARALVAPPHVASPSSLFDEESTTPHARLDDEDPDAVTVAHARRKTPPPPPLLGAPRVAIDALPSPPKVVLQAPPPPAVPAIPTMLSEGALAEAARASSAVLEARASKVEVVVPPRPAEPPPEPEPQAPEDMSVEAYAAIAAELAQKGIDRAAVLRRHKLTIATWGAIDRRFSRAMSEQSERGERALQSTFDAAYVAAQGRLRKPIGVREYARIQVGLERGEVGRVLVELELQLSDLMRLQRVWTKKLADAPKLAAELGRAVEEARKG